MTITSLATLDGRLAIDLTGGFTLAKDESFDILNFMSLTGKFDALALDGSACWMAAAYSWSCGGGVNLDEVIHPKSLDLVVAGGSAVLASAGSAVREPATWAMLLMGLLGLGGLGLVRREGQRFQKPFSG
jgi:hypothetical protein